MSSKHRQPQITFDEFNRLRILDSEYAKHTEQLVEDSGAFIGKLAQFNKAVENLTVIVNQQAEKLEAEKLKAIGERTAIDCEEDHRQRRLNELKHSIAAAAMDTQRAQDYLDSLLRIENENRLIIEKLGSV